MSPHAKDPDAVSEEEENENDEEQGEKTDSDSDSDDDNSIDIDNNEVVKNGNASAVCLGSMVVYQQKGMGVLVNFPDKKKIEKILA